jgi:hypothetical protein
LNICLLLSIGKNILLILENVDKFPQKYSKKLATLRYFRFLEVGESTFSCLSLLPPMSKKKQI